MKGKKNFKILVFLLISILFTSIGYAAISGINLTIGGTAFAKGGEVIVKFSDLNSDIETSSNCLLDSGRFSSCAIINTNILNDRTANFNINGLKGYGDTATVRFKIVNNSEKNVELNIDSILNNNSDYFSVTSNLENNILNSGENTTLAITVKVNKIVDSGSNLSTNVTVTVSPSIIN